MKLCELYIDRKETIEITGLSTDSRFVEVGDLFLPLPGQNFSGEEFFIEAQLKGAVAIVFNKIVDNLTVPLIIVSDLEAELKRLLDILYDKPYNKLKTIGVTGTDGKTSTSTLINYLLNKISKSINIGTNGIEYIEDVIDTPFTTLPLSENIRIMSKALKDDYKYITMEASSEGIKNKRIADIKYDYTIFTNLSHEHLNTHITMENYFLTKFRLFSNVKDNGLILVNKDDNYAKYFDELKNVIYYSLFSPSDYQATNIRYDNQYALFDLKTKTSLFKDIKINRCEQYNIYNILPGIIISLLEGITIKKLYEALLTLPIIKGRLEKVPIRYPFDVYVDFAHTPNGVKNLLQELRKKAKNRLILVIGAAGGKDRSKRELIGSIAMNLSDVVIFTKEDPRNENPLDIINDMIGLNPIGKYKIILDRRKALEYAFKIAKKDDVIVVTGKGRETYMEENNMRIPYSDFNSILDIRI